MYIIVTAEDVTMATFKGMFTITLKLVPVEKIKSQLKFVCSESVDVVFKYLGNLVVTALSVYLFNIQCKTQVKFFKHLRFIT